MLVVKESNNAAPDKADNGDNDKANVADAPVLSSTDQNALENCEALVASLAASVSLLPADDPVEVKGEVDGDLTEDEDKEVKAKKAKKAKERPVVGKTLFKLKKGKKGGAAKTKTLVEEQEEAVTGIAAATEAVAVVSDPAPDADAVMSSAEVKVPEAEAQTATTAAKSGGKKRKRKLGKGGKGAKPTAASEAMPHVEGAVSEKTEEKKKKHKRLKPGEWGV